MRKFGRHLPGITAHFAICAALCFSLFAAASSARADIIGAVGTTTGVCGGQSVAMAGTIPSPLAVGGSDQNANWGFSCVVTFAPRGTNINDVFTVSGADSAIDELW